MKYELKHSINGPVVVAEDEVFFLNDFRFLEEAVKEVPDFLDEAYEFIRQQMSLRTEQLLDELDKVLITPSPMQDIHSYYQASNALKEFKMFQASNQESGTGFPGDSFSN